MAPCKPWKGLNKIKMDFKPLKALNNDKTPWKGLKIASFQNNAPLTSSCHANITMSVLRSINPCIKNISCCLIIYPKIKLASKGEKSVFCFWCSKGLNMLRHAMWHHNTHGTMWCFGKHYNKLYSEHICACVIVYEIL